jgi:hypothetical protein
MPSAIEQEIIKPALERLWRILLRFIRKGVNNPPLRLLAAAMRKGIRQVQRDIRELVKLGKLIVTEHRVDFKRNAPNSYTLVDLQPALGVIDDTEKQGEVLKTSTPPRENPRVAMEARRKQDDEDRQRMRKNYDDKAAFWAMCKQTRVGKALERGSNALRASLGVYKGEPTVCPDEWVQAFRKREAERAPTLLQLLREGGSR